MKNYVTDNNQFLADGETPNPNFGATTVETFSEAEVVSPKWDVLSFTRRFTQAERIALRTLAKTNAQAEDFLDLLNKAGLAGVMIHADDPDVLAAVTAFESASLLDAGRAAVILGPGPSPVLT